MEEELKSGDNLKPDTSDRRPAHNGRKARQNNLKINLSRQHFMIGGGIIILLLLIFAIASALNSPDKAASDSQANGSAKEVNLSGSDNSQPNMSNDSREGNSAGNTDMGMVQGQPQNNSLAQAPQNGMPQDVANNSNGGIMPDEQAQQPGGDGMSPLGGLPVGPATLIGAAGRATQSQNMATNNASGGNTSLRPVRNRQEPVHRVETRRPAEAHKAASAKVNNSAKASQVAATSSKVAPAKSTVPAHTQTTNTSSSTVATSTPTAPATTSTPAAAASNSSVTGHYTLQLSGASQPNTLDAFAKKQKLSNYQVYKTNRNGQPWYVLISGSYATPAEAKNAIAAMPDEVKAKNPWVRQISQIQSAK